MKGKIAIPGHSGEIDVSPKDLNALQKFFSFIIPEFMKDNIGILNDNAKFKRFKNLLQITYKAEKLKSKYNLKILPLPLKPSIEYMEAASLEENPILQSMWANLLVNSSSKPISTAPIFISILKELRANDAKVLQYIYDFMKSKKIDTPFNFNISKYGVVKDLKIERSEFEVIINNLERLKLVQPPKIFRPISLSIPYKSRITYGGSSDSQTAIIKHLEEENRKMNDSESKIQFTMLGYKLLEACNEFALSNSTK